ncbi:hypothetical protein KSP40_PGU009223 [Platanthera guangdongensis]|uniref:AAA+ ATPase domain-containing protein n=1 Tax=Platanthera guangdongensis TaxID=2320717 RepID=A0ABR2MU29_9ASPA
MEKQRRRSGGRSPFSPSIINRQVLIRRIKSMNLSSSSNPDFLIQRMREHYPDYARVKLQPFSARIREVLQHLRNSSNKSPASGEASQSFSDNSAAGEMPSHKKRDKKDVFVEHLRRWQSKNLAPTLPSDSSDDSTSTSEDAVFEKNTEPVFDITKSMLREKYVKQSEQTVNKMGKEKNVEIESVANDKKKMEISTRKEGVSGKAGPVLGLEFGASDRGKDFMAALSGREGPMFRDLGGMKKVLEELMIEVLVPLFHPELPKRLGVRPISGILLHGPPGCGKTKLAHAIANEASVPFYKISATEVVSGVSGASEEFIRDLFNKAYRTSPSIVFIDEIDAIASKRESLQREMERRIVTQLMTCMDDSRQTMGGFDNESDLEASNKSLNRMPGYVLVIGATNRPDAVDHALRRPGRFDKEIALSIPNENARAEILAVLTRNLRHNNEFNLFTIARFTPGFVGADLAALVNKAGNLAMKRIIDKKRSQLAGHNEENIDWWKHPWSPEEIENLSITMFDFEEAKKLVQPSTKREGFSLIPNIKWEDVGGLDSLMKAFNHYIVQRIKNPVDYKREPSSVLTHDSSHTMPHYIARPLIVLFSRQPPGFFLARRRTPVTPGLLWARYSIEMSDLLRSLRAARLTGVSLIKSGLRFETQPQQPAIGISGCVGPAQLTTPSRSRDPTLSPRGFSFSGVSSSPPIASTSLASPPLTCAIPPSPATIFSGRPGLRRYDSYSVAAAAVSIVNIAPLTMTSNSYSESEFNFVSSIYKQVEELGLDIKVGFLLYGPPGCGKTLIAKALANEAGANFIHIKVWVLKFSISMLEKVSKKLEQSLAVQELVLHV